MSSSAIGEFMETVTYVSLQQYCMQVTIFQDSRKIFLAIIPSCYRTELNTVCEGVMLKNQKTNVFSWSD